MEAMDYQITENRNDEFLEKQQTLTEMGFDEISVISALETADGNLDTAMGILLDGNTFSNSSAFDSSQMNFDTHDDKGTSNINKSIRTKPRVDMRETHKKFMMAYKIDKCRVKLPHDRRLCMFYHSRSDRRRNPYEYPYAPSECQLSNETSVCEDGDNCLRSHNMLERMFHPELFKISMCQRGINGGTCERGNFCAFAHSEDDLRIPQVRVNPPSQASVSSQQIALHKESNAGTGAPPPQSGGNTLHERLLRLVKSSGKAGVRQANLSKVYYDTFSEKIPVEEANEKNSLKEMLLANPNISLVISQGQPTYFYDDKGDYPVRVGLGYRDVTAGITTSNPAIQSGNSAGNSMNSAISGNFGSAPKHEGLGSDSTSVPNSMLYLPPNNQPSPLQITSSGAHAVSTTEAASVNTHPAATKQGLIHDALPTLIPVKSRPRGPALPLPNFSLEVLSRMDGIGGNQPDRQQSAISSLTSSLSHASPLSFSDPVFIDTNMSMSNNVDLLVDDRAPLGPTDSASITPFQRAIGAVGAGPRRRGPSLSMEELSLGQLAVNSFTSISSPNLASLGVPMQQNGSLLPPKHTPSPPPGVPHNHIATPMGRPMATGHVNELSLADYSEHAMETNNKMKQLLIQIEQLTRDLDAKTKQCSDTSQAAEESLRKQVKLEDSLQSITKEKNALEELCQQQREGHTVNMSLIASQNKELQYLRESLKEKETVITKAEATKNSLVSELKQLRMKFSNVEKELENTKNMSRSQRNEYEKKRMAQMREFESIKSELNITKSQLSNEKIVSRQQLEVLQNALRVSEDSRNQLAEDVRRVQEAHTAAVADHQDLVKQMNIFKAALTDFAPPPATRHTPAAPSTATESKAVTDSKAASSASNGAGGKKQASKVGERDLSCTLPGCTSIGSFRCGACNGSSYCGPEHQREHWRFHKKECALIKASTQKALNGSG